MHDKTVVVSAMALLDNGGVALRFSIPTGPDVDSPMRYHRVVVDAGHDPANVLRIVSEHLQTQGCAPLPKECLAAVCALRQTHAERREKRDPAAREDPVDREQQK